MPADQTRDDRIFEAVPLMAGTARRAYALAQLLDSRIGMRQWLHYTRDCHRGTGGLTGLVDRRGYVHAFFAWTIRSALGNGRILRICDLVIGHLPGHSLCDALIEAIDDMARSAACTTILLEPTTGSLSAHQRALFIEAGFSAIPADRYLIGRRPPPEPDQAPEDGPGTEVTPG